MAQRLPSTVTFYISMRRKKWNQWGPHLQWECLPGASLRSLAGCWGRPSSSCSCTTSSSATSSQLFRWDFGISSEWWGGGWSDQGSMVISIFPTRGLAEGDHVLVLNLSGGENLLTGRKTYQYLILFYRTQVRPVVGLVKMHYRTYWSLYPWLTYSHLIVVKVSFDLKLFIGPESDRFLALSLTD